MIKIFILSLIFLLNLNANEDLTAQKQNTLYVQNLIEIEEKIARNFEKYILTEFKFPRMSDLIDVDNKYLGSNFSVKNRMGVDIDFLSASQLKIKYLVSNDVYINSPEDYVIQLYNRDLYRNLTSVDYEIANSKIDITKSYVEIKLQSDEAKTIFNLLSAGKSISKNCNTIPTSGNYCNYNQKTIRWYKDATKYIEYSKKDFNKGNILVKGMTKEEVESETAQLENLIVGAYIFIDAKKYVNMFNSGTTLQILEVN